jgi:type I pantothenate kinase
VDELAQRIEAALRTSARPYLVAITGSVAVGKSTLARSLASSLAVTWKVDVVNTDGFLFPNAELEARGLMQRKGFPESYDQAALDAFVSSLKSGAAPLRVPLYSHGAYDVTGDVQIVDRSDVVILEGLQSIRDGVDFSIYLDAPEPELEAWFLARLFALREDPNSFLHAYSEEALLPLAKEVWRTINLANLREHIAPYRELAHVVVEKGPGHVVTGIRQRAAEPSDSRRSTPASRSSR